MEAFVGLLLFSLSVSVQLGVPVVVLFVAGYLAHRESRRRSDPRGPERDKREPATAATVLPSDDAAGKGPNWQFKRCPPAGTAQASLPCWQVVKTERGRLRSECMDCRLFLTPARRG